MKRVIFRLLEAVLLTLDGWVKSGLAWIDLHYPDPDIDELIREIEDAHRRAVADRPDLFENVVHLPRTRRH